MIKHLRARKRSLAETVVVLLLAVSLTVCAVEEQAFAAGLPTLDSKLSVSDIKTLTKKYDKDGYFLAKQSLDKDNSLFGMIQFFYFSPDTPTIVALDTFVHEAFHNYTRPSSNPTIEGKADESMTVYVGNGKGIKVHFTPIFRSKKIVKTVPKRCRTSIRFSMYVEDTGETMLSDWDGVYGLLNEFGGYCWGMNNNNCMFAYRDRFADTEETWSNFISQGESDRVAYAEFKYYILHYLYYAKKNKPGIYKKIMANEPFKEAYRAIEGQFADEITLYEKDLKQIQSRLKRAGSSSTATGMVKKVGVRKWYNVLVKEMNKKQYRQIQDELAE